MATSIQANRLEIREQIIEIGQILAAKNLLPATSGNLSMRDLDSGVINITVSGKPKGKLTINDFIEIDIKANPVTNSSARPSAETLLHTQLYSFFPDINTVIHIHSTNSVIISKLFAKQKKLQLENYELLKALNGINTHAHTEIVPIFSNSQNIKELADEVEAYMQTNPKIHGYLIEGHGLYTWGSSQAEALRHTEALETLFEIERKLYGIS